MGFLIKCNNCGSEDVTIPVSAGEYENEVFITCDVRESESSVYC